MKEGRINYFENVRPNKVYCAISSEGSVWFDTQKELFEFNEHLEFGPCKHEFYRFDYLGTYNGIEDTFLVSWMRGFMPGDVVSFVVYEDSKLVNFNNSDRNVILYDSKDMKDPNSTVSFDSRELYYVFRNRGIKFSNDFYADDCEHEKTLSILKSRLKSF